MPRPDAEKAMDALLLCRSYLRHALSKESRPEFARKLRDCLQCTDALRHEIRDLEAMTDPKGEVKHADQRTA